MKRFESVLPRPDLAFCEHCLRCFEDAVRCGQDDFFLNCPDCGPAFASFFGESRFERPTLAHQKTPKGQTLARDKKSFSGQGRLWRHAPGDKKSKQTTGAEQSPGQAAIEAAAQDLLDGKILAIKGITAFHLACDAYADLSVQTLRERKHRPHKPFALMAASLDQLRQITDISNEDARLLSGPKRPIVLCRLKPGLESIFQRTAPQLGRIGVFLPYSLIHYALLRSYGLLYKKAGRDENSAFPPLLLMSSGNAHGAPACTDNRQALTELSGIADVFLFHDRDICIRTDDSLVLGTGTGGPMVLRRGRGYVPSIDTLPFSLDAPSFLAMGGDINGAFALSRGNEVFLSQHMGDLGHLDCLNEHEHIRQRLCAMSGLHPERVLADMHPAYASHHAAEALGLPLTLVQHHAAHAYALLAEHGYTKPALIAATDGSGFSPDGTVWGGEILLADPQSGRCERVAHCKPLRLPGFEQAIREPWRLAHAFLLEHGRFPSEKTGYSTGGYALPWLPDKLEQALALSSVLASGKYCPPSSSVGRLFDLTAALLGLCRENSFEGHGALYLESLQDRCVDPLVPPFPCPFLRPEPSSKVYVLDTHKLALAVLDACEQRKNPPWIARAFHLGLGFGLARLMLHLSKELEVSQLGFTGGCMQNGALTVLLRSALKEQHPAPFFHERFPPNDGSLALGQIYYAGSVQGYVRG